MWLDRLYLFFKGYCEFEATGPYPERLLNLAARKNIGLWNTVKTENGISAFIEASQYRRLLQPARKCSMRLKVVQKCGLPFLIMPYRFRPGIPLGVIMFFITLGFLSQFVWYIDLPDDVSPETLARIEVQLEESGLRAGTLRTQVSGKVISSEIMRNVPNLSWAGVSKDGCVVKVEATELDEKEPADTSSPRNLVAACDGVIESVLCTSGQIQVQNGDAVMRGELLISGVVEYGDGSIDFVCSQGEVIAQTNFFISKRVEYEQMQYTRTGKFYTVRRLSLFGLEIPLWFGEMPQGNFDRETELYRPDISGYLIPFELRVERWYELEPQIVEIDRQTAMAKARALVGAELGKMELVEVVSTEEDIAFSEFAATCTVYVTARQSIAVPSEIYLGE